MPSQLPLHLTGVFMRIINQTDVAKNLVIGLVIVQSASPDPPRILWAKGLLRYYRDYLEVHLNAEAISLHPAVFPQTLETLIRRGEIPLAVLTRPRGSTQTNCHWDTEAVQLSGRPIEALTAAIQEKIDQFFASLPSNDEPCDTTGPALPPELIPGIARSLHRDIELAQAKGVWLLALVFSKPGRRHPTLFWNVESMIAPDPAEPVPYCPLADHLIETQIREALQAGFFPVALAFFSQHKGPYLSYDTAKLTEWGFNAKAEMDRTNKILRRTLVYLARPWADVDN